MADKPKASKPTSYKNPMLALARANERLAETEKGLDKARRRQLATKIRQRAMLEGKPAGKA